MGKKNQETLKGTKEELKKTVANLKLLPNNIKDIPLGESIKQGHRLNKYIFFIFGGLLFFLLTIGYFFYYKNNFSSEAVLKKTLFNLNSNRNFKYSGSVKLTFSSADNRENLDLNEIEI